MHLGNCRSTHRYGRSFGGGGGGGGEAERVEAHRKKLRALTKYKYVLVRAWRHTFVGSVRSAQCPYVEIARRAAQTETSEVGPGAAAGANTASTKAHVMRTISAPSPVADTVRCGAVG